MTPQCECFECRSHRAERRVLLAFVAVVLGIVALLCSGCGTIHTSYHARVFDPPGSGKVASEIDGVLTRRALGLRSTIPQFRVGPTNGAVIETSGSLETSGDAAYLKAALQGIINGIK